MQTRIPEKITHTIPDVLSLTGISRTTLYRLIGEGQLEALKLGRRTLIPDNSLRALLASLPRIPA